jgi:hypothetical protein
MAPLVCTTTTSFISAPRYPQTNQFSSVEDNQPELIGEHKPSLSKVS